MTEQINWPGDRAKIVEMVLASLTNFDIRWRYITKPFMKMKYKRYAKVYNSVHDLVHKQVDRLNAEIAENARGVAAAAEYEENKDETSEQCESESEEQIDLPLEPGTVILPDDATGQSQQRQRTASVDAFVGNPESKQRDDDSESIMPLSEMYDG